MQLDVGDRRIGGGRTRRILPNGDFQIIDADGTFRSRADNHGNLFDDIGTNINAIPTNANLDRVTLVDFNGGVLATYNRGPAGWVRVP